MPARERVASSADLSAPRLAPLGVPKRKHSMSTRRRRLDPSDAHSHWVVTVRTTGLVSATPLLVSSTWLRMGARAPRSASARPPPARARAAGFSPLSRAPTTRCKGATPAAGPGRACGALRKKKTGVTGLVSSRNQSRQKADDKRKMEGGATPSFRTECALACRPCAGRVRRGRSDRSGEGQMGRSAMWRAG